MKHEDIIKVFKYNKYVFESKSASDIWCIFHTCYPDVSYQEFAFGAMAYYQSIITESQFKLYSIIILNNKN